MSLIKRINTPASVTVVLAAFVALTRCAESPGAPNAPAAGRAAPAAGPAWFEEVAAERGLNWASRSLKHMPWNCLVASEVSGACTSWCSGTRVS